jgi:hypothetical protein
MRTTLLASLVLGACANGTAPEISALTYTPETVSIGQSTVSGSITFDDPDGDLANLNLEITTPDGQVQTIPSANIAAIGDATTGSLPFAMVFIPPAIGDYTFQLWISDDEGNDSNRLDGSLAVE